MVNNQFEAITFENKMTTCFLGSDFKTYFCYSQTNVSPSNRFYIIHCHHPLRQIVASFAEIHQHTSTISLCRLFSEVINLPIILPLYVSSNLTCCVDSLFKQKGVIF